jgi:hypothetical protein
LVHPQTAFVLLWKPKLGASINSLRIAMDTRILCIHKQPSYCYGNKNFLHPETAFVLLWKPKLGASMNSLRIAMKARTSSIYKTAFVLLWEPETYASCSSLRIPTETRTSVRVVMSGPTKQFALLMLHYNNSSFHSCSRKRSDDI